MRVFLHIFFALGDAQVLRKGADWSFRRIGAFASSSEASSSRGLVAFYFGRSPCRERRAAAEPSRSPRPPAIENRHPAIEIGILSDTHGYFHPDLTDVFEGVDLILHAGDVGDPAILDGLEAVAPVRAVFGNVDGRDVRSRRPETERFEAAGLSFWMTHIAGRPGRWQRGMGRRLADDGPPDVFICGHSHILQIERLSELDDMLFLNPGAAGRHGRHREKTCVRLTTRDGRATSADVVHLDD